MTGPIYRLPPYTVSQVVRSLAETVDWGLSSYGIPKLWTETQGKDVKVAVLDTGCDLDHPDLQKGLLSARDFTGSPSGVEDRQGHGTHVSGTIAARQNDVGVVGVAPSVSLLAGKVLGDDGSGAHSWIAAGIHWADESGADIISMSLGSSQPSRQIGYAIQTATKHGRFVVCAAGNDGRNDSVNWPAKRQEAIAVGAVDRNGRAAPFSSRGPQVDVGAPGVDVLSTWKDGRYAKLSGTSMATPFVSGVVALMLAKHRQRGGETPVRNVSELREHLQKTSRDVGPPGHDTETGWGLIHPEAMLGPGDGNGGDGPVLEFGGVRIYAPAQAGNALGIDFGD